MTIDFSNTILCGVSVQASLEWTTLVAVYQHVICYIQLDMGFALSKLLCDRFYKCTDFHEMT